MKKVIVIGCPGSGKSVFSRKLKDATGLPLYHLDMLYWNADKTIVEKDVFLSRLHEVMIRDEWIIDGNFASTMEKRMAACDTIFFLDYATKVCLEGIESRRGKSRSDMPWVESGEWDEEFISRITNFPTESRPQVMALLEKYAEKHICIFREREEAEEFLLSLQ